MSSRKDRRSGGLAVQWPYIVGVAFIALATVTNIALDGMTRNEVDALPPAIREFYGAAGKLGVTVVFVSAGLIAICVGLVVQSFIGGSRRTGGWLKTGESNAAPVGPGQVPLDTNKYLGWSGRSSVREWGTPE
jgi:hypothetical protein